MRAAAAVISDGFGEALAASRLIRNASLYVGLLFVLLAGGGVLAELGVLTWSEGLDFRGGIPTTAAADAANRANLILILGVICSLMVVIDATAVGMTLLASRLIGRPLTLRSAIQRARQVFWRLFGANLVVGVTELIGSAIFRLAIGDRPDAVDGVRFFTVEPLVGALVSIPFVLTTAGIVIADDSVGAALGRSVRLARRSLPIAVALALFGFVFSFIGQFAIGEGSGILLRIAEAIHLDVKSGTASFVVAAAVALAILSAFGSILFTIGAVVSSAQATAFIRFGMPTGGLDRVTPPEPVTLHEPVTLPELATLPELPTPPESVEPAVRAEPEPVVEPVPIPGAAPDPVPSTPTQSEWATWAARREAANPRGTRWISIPMRAVGAFLWLVALAAVVSGPPH
jgi:hypothetical protein